MHDYINNINDNQSIDSTNVSQSDNSSTKNINRNLNIGLTNNIFVYNKKSCPTHLCKKIREQLELSPEVLAILLHDVKDSNKNKDKNSNKTKTLRVLLDSGALTNTIRARHVKGHNRETLKFPVKWDTTNGSFETTETVDAKFHLPEFTNSTTI